jgi:hypothetical protein
MCTWQGGFSTAGGQPANGIARWNGSAWSAPGGAVNLSVNTLTLFDGALIAGGNFTAAGGQPALHVARWNGTAWSPIGAGLPDQVDALAVLDGALHAATFHVIQSTPNLTYASQLYRWNGATWTALAQPVNGPVFDLASLNGNVWAGGLFTTAGNVVSAYTARLGCQCYPNCDASTASPVLNVADFICFLNKYAAADPYANCDQSTAAPTLNVADFTAS